MLQIVFCDLDEILKSNVSFFSVGGGRVLTKAL